MEAIRVVINGALGKMGREVTKAVHNDPELRVVGAAEKKVTQQYLALPETSELIPFSSDLSSLLGSCNPDVVVDFTDAEACAAAARISLRHKVNMVIGTTGLSEENLREIGEMCRVNDVCAVVAPNFSLGAALLMRLARVAAKFFDNVEIIEMHHDKKIDAPSGTAITTARAMLEAHGGPFLYPKTEREVVRNSRGGEIDGIAIHSVRLPGFMAGQQVILSGKGETLSLHHEVISRESYAPGVVMAVKKATTHKGLIHGLDVLLEL